jgi:hypothetical protein
MISSNYRRNQNAMQKCTAVSVCVAKSPQLPESSDFSPNKDEKLPGVFFLAK